MPSSIKQLIIFHTIINLLVTYPFMKWLCTYEDTFFKKKTFIYVLIYISTVSLYSIILILVFLIFQWIGKVNQGKKGKMLSTFVNDIENIFSMKIIVGLGFFKILPLVELLVAFFGEFFTGLFNNVNVMFLFCSIYPVLMGAIQKSMDFINTECNLELELVAELYSLLYASMPYKLVYLNIEETLIGFIVLGIKFTYKMIIYVIVPAIKVRKANISSVAPYKGEEGNILQSHEFLKNKNENQKDKITKKKILQIEKQYQHHEQKPIQERSNEQEESIGVIYLIDDHELEESKIKMNKEENEKSPNSAQFDDSSEEKIKNTSINPNKSNEESKNLSFHRKFVLKFIIHTFSDTTQNLAVFTLIFTMNLVIVNFKSDSRTLSKSLVTNVIIWTLSELLMDLVFFFVCLTLFQKWWFRYKEARYIKNEYLSWMKNVKLFLFIGVIGVAFLTFYIVFFVTEIGK